MKQNYIKFFIGLLCMVWLSAFAVPTTAHAEESEDTRTHIDRVDISTNIDSVFGYGKENTTLGPTLQMTQTTSEPVSLKPYYGFWQRYIDDDGRWEFSGYEYFISGQWSMTIQIRVTDVAYLIDNETAVYVDGELWEVWDKEDGSYPFIVVIPSRNSSRFLIEEPEELTFHKLGKYDISGQRVNTRIEPFSVVSSVEGGTAPYSYRKVSGPDWLEVSIEGTVSGKPTEIGANEPLVVEVLDSKGEKAQITIPVDDTLEEYVIEVSSWQELENAFSQATGSGTKKKYLTIRLTKDLYSSAYSTERDAQWIHQYEIYCASVIFDFNGHTLSCEDDVSDTDIEYTLKDFINIKLSSGSYDFGSSIRFIDSVGGGGIEMYSKRAWETCDLAALHIEAGESSFYGVHQVYFDGGKYELNAESSKVGVGTLSPLVDYRGCVITEEVSVEINDGHFIAKGEGAKFSVGDTCARELSAFGTFEHARFNVTSVEEIEKMFGWDEIVINGGIFESNGYAVHHFDISENGLDSTRGMLFPTINGGYFIGQMGYTGLTFTYSDGNELFNNQPATSIISKDSYVMGIDKDGDKFYTLEDITLKDLHDLQSCIVLGKETVQMKTSPVAGSYPASLIRESTQTETYTIEYKEPSWFTMGGIQCVPYYSIQGWNSGVTPTSKTGKTEVTVDYSKYKHNGGVNVSLGVMYLTPWNTQDYFFENVYNVELQVFYDVTDACENCYITPVNGKYNVFKGNDFSFKITADENYEIDESGSLEVSINPSNYGEVTWDSATNTYTVHDVVGDISISVNKNTYGPTGVLQLKLEKSTGVLTDIGSQLAGTTYTLMTPAEYGLTVPDGYTFEKWTVTMNGESRSYSSGESIALSGAGYVIISPKYKNLYNIQVINGKAYADAEHTQQISSSKEGTIYLVADEPATGERFWKWKMNQNDYSFDSAISKYIDSDLVFEACYGTVIDEVALTVLSEDIAPEAGKTVPQVVLEASEFYDYKGLEYYDVTDGTPLTVGTANFEVGHVYRIQVQAWVKTDAGYVFDDIAKMKAIVEGLTGYESVEFASVSGYDREQYKVLITFPVIEGPEGVTVSGTITSSGSEGYRVEVTLTNVENENISYVRYLMGNSTTYSIDGVMPGTYTLKVEKIGHVDYETTVVVDDADVVQDVELEPKPLASFKTISLVLESAIDINFWILRDDLCTDEGTYAVIELNGREQIVPMENWTTGSWKATDDSYKISYKGVAAKEMRDLITITVYDSNGIAISNELSYTLGRAIVSTYVYATDEDLKALCIEMLYYGAAAQKVFNYKEDDLATKYFDEYSSYFEDIDHASIRDSLMPVEVLEVINAQDSGAAISDTLASFKTISLVLESAIDINFWILKNDLNTDEGTYAVIELNGREQIVPMENWTTGSWKATDDSYKISYKGVAAKEMRDVITITVYDSNGIAISNELSYTLGRAIVSTYVYATDEDLKALCIEMLYYGAAAQKVFNYKESDLATRYFEEYAQYFEGIN